MEKRGWGSYLLNKQTIFFSLNDTFEWKIYSMIVPMDNCGIKLAVEQQEKLGKTDMANSVHIKKMNDIIIKEKKLKCYISLDFSNHWKYDFKKFYFYWDNNKLYSCYQN